jgi:hypothetical protein
LCHFILLNVGKKMARFFMSFRVSRMNQSRLLYRRLSVASLTGSGSLWGGTGTGSLLLVLTDCTGTGRRALVSRLQGIGLE